ncbi:fibronectin type III domain-containing protein [Phytohabitans kaempferiae]|uniref:Fibronectin type III domain-containing protein n=1 Tax=Phytohabitans kaempferiae TaxID=1620943 RepID=A0ABV6LW51_9ACTN
MRARRRALTVFVLSALAMAMTATTGLSPAAAQPFCDRIPTPPACSDPDPDPPRSHNPTGTLASVHRVPTGVQVSGEAQDPDSTSPVTVEIKIDNVSVGSLVAHGGRYSGVVPARAGSRVCATAHNIGHGSNAGIGCKDVTIYFSPMGMLESIGAEGDKVRVRGWAVDPDTAGPVVLEARDGSGNLLGTITANQSRPDIGQANPGYGDLHGFDALLPDGGRDDLHTVCLRMLNVGQGVNIDLLCRGYWVRHQPYGSFDTLTRDGATLRVGGWVADPDDKAAKLAVRVNVDGAVVHEGLADVSRTGDGWGFDLGGIPAATEEGSHGVCVWARNVGFGVDPWTEIDCRGYNMPGNVAPPVIRPLVKNDTLFWLRNQVRWTNHESVEGVRVERSVADGPWQEVYRVNGKVDVYNDTDVQAGTRYCYRVITTNTRPSEASAQVCGNSLLPAPQAPTGVQVAEIGDTSLTITWNDNSGTEDGYSIKVTGGGTSRTVTLPAMAGTGKRQETITGLSAVTGYTILVKPFQNTAADLPDDQAGKVEAWTTGAPRIDTFSANPTRPQACQPVNIQLTWSVSGATRITVTRDGAQIYNAPRSTPGQWDQQISGGSNDGNVTYVLTATNTAGQTTTRQVKVERDTPIRLVKRLNLTNVSMEPMRVYHVDMWGNELQLLDELIPGETYPYTPPNCQKVRMVVKLKLSGRVVYDTFDILGHQDGIDIPQRVSNPYS